MSDRCATQRGFSKPEFIFLLGFILLVLSIVAPVAMLLREKKYAAQARRDIVELVNATGRFYHEYGIWPTYAMGEKEDRRLGDKFSNSEVIMILSDVEQGDAVLNTHHVKFLERTSNFLDELADPWGTPYQMVLDTDLNNICRVERSAYESIVGEGFVVWSCGPDRVSDTADDIRSWTFVKSGRLF